MMKLLMVLFLMGLVFCQIQQRMSGDYHQIHVDQISQIQKKLYYQKAMKSLNHQLQKDYHVQVSKIDKIEQINIYGKGYRFLINTLIGIFEAIVKCPPDAQCIVQKLIPKNEL